MTTDIRIDEVLTHILERDPHATAQKLAYSLKKLPQIVVAYLRDGLGMKCSHLRWILYMLTFSQKVTCLEVPKVMTQQLAMHANAGFQHRLTGDESHMACNYTPSRMWTIAESDVDPIARPTSHPRKIMMTIFFGVNNITFIDILLEKAKLSSEYFKENIIKELDLVIYPARRKVEATHMYLHFDNILFQNT
jgi:hypothetical protein